jgi:hypothetical protein
LSTLCLPFVPAVLRLNRELAELAPLDARDALGCEGHVEVSEHFFELGDCLALGDVLRKLGQKTEPEIAILPVDVANSPHRASSAKRYARSWSICVDPSTQFIGGKAFC